MRTLIAALVALCLVSVHAQASEKDPCGENKTPLPACSYTITNSSCTVTIDRMNPVTPPTIYVFPACKVHVQVSSTSVYPLERLTLDWKSNAAVVPPDTFQSAFTSLSANLGKIAYVGPAPPGGGARVPAVAVFCEDSPGACASAADLSSAQIRVGLKVDAIDPFAGIENDIAEIGKALQPPPGGSDTPGQPWQDTANWQSVTVSSLQSVTKTIARQLSKFQSEQTNLAADLTKLKGAASTPAERADADQLADNQKTLDSKIEALSATVDKINALAAGIKVISLDEKGIDGNNVISDTTLGDKNYDLQTWALDYSNKLLPLAQRVAADTLKSEDAAKFANLASASNKQPIITITVQFQSPSRFEFSTGLIVPVTPYHSYAIGSNSSGTSIAAETKTYAVVPIALVHYRVHEWKTRQYRSAFFFTGGVGVNSANTQVDFGAGVTYSYRSLAIDFLASIGPDTNLGGNLTPNGPLSPYTTPPTTTGWGARFAPGISVRIPLGGSSSSASPSTGSTTGN